jgi:hypothetical protein
LLSIGSDADPGENKGAAGYAYWGTRCAAECANRLYDENLICTNSWCNVVTLCNNDKYQDNIFFSFRPPAVMMAGMDKFEIRIEGRGGHGGMPQLTRDPVLAAAETMIVQQEEAAHCVIRAQIKNKYVSLIAQQPH